MGWQDDPIVAPNGQGAPPAPAWASDPIVAPAAQPAAKPPSGERGSLYDPAHPVLSDDPRDWPKVSPGLVHQFRAWLAGRTLEAAPEEPRENRGTFVPLVEKPGQAPELGVPGIFHGPYAAAKQIMERGPIHPSEVTPDDAMSGIVAGSAAVPVKGFPSGALAAAEAPAIVSGTADVAARSAGAFSRPMRAALNPGREADMRVAEAYQADIPPPALGPMWRGARGDRAPQSPAEMTPEMLQHSGANALQERAGATADGSYGADARLMDIGGEKTRALARSAANLAPEAREALNRVIQPRFESQGPRFIEFLESMSGGNAQASRDALQEMARTTRAPFYDRAFADGAGGIHTEAIAKLAQSPVMKDAMVKAQKAVEDSKAAGMLRTSMSTPTGYTLEFWDQVKRVLDDKVRNLSKDRFTEEATRVDRIRSSLVKELDVAVPSYAHARGVAHGIFKATDALDAGEQFVTSKLGNEEARRGLALMTPQEQDLFRQGFVGRYVSQIHEVGDRRNVLNTIAQSGAARERLEIALGPEGARDLEAFLRHENMMDFVRGAVGGNSTTARQLMELGLASGAGGLVTSFDPHNPASWIAGILTGFFTRRLARSMNAAIDTRLATEIADRLTSRDPTVYRRGLAQLAEPKVLEQLRKFDDVLSDASKHGGPRLIAGDQQERGRKPDATGNAMAAASDPSNALRVTITPPEGATATNHETGERVQRVRGKWVPLQQ